MRTNAIAHDLIRNNFRLLAVGAICFLLSAMAIPARAAATEETAEQRNARMEWWREAKFGMFIHWGV